jgi:hypothetical protein
MDLSMVSISMIEEAAAAIINISVVFRFSAFTTGVFLGKN